MLNRGDKVRITFGSDRIHMGSETKRLGQTAIVQCYDPVNSWDGGDCYYVICEDGEDISFNECFLDLVGDPVPNSWEDMLCS